MERQWLEAPSCRRERLEGARVIEFYDQRGEAVVESRRAVDANTLIWQARLPDGQVGKVVYRLEGDLTLEEGLRIAESLR